MIKLKTCFCFFLKHCHSFIPWSSSWAREGCWSCPKPIWDWWEEDTSARIERISYSASLLSENRHRYRGFHRPFAGWSPLNQSQPSRNRGVAALPELRGMIEIHLIRRMLSSPTLWPDAPAVAGAGHCPNQLTGCCSDVRQEACRHRLRKTVQINNSKHLTAEMVL